MAGTTPFNPPVTLDEIWKNILFDMGVVVPTSKGGPIDMAAILRAFDSGLAGKGSAPYGYANDGKVTFDGTAVVLGLTPSTGVYTLTRDIYLATGSTITSAATIECAGFRIFCVGNLIVNGTIRSNGKAAVANTAGGALSYSGTISNTTVGAAGAAGSTTTGSAGGASATNSLGGAGAAGGSNVSGPNAGAAGGAVTGPVATVQGPYTVPLAYQVRVIGTTALALCTGGAGGGGGGGDSTNVSGGGGGGGGIVVVVAQVISGTGTISAQGGAGGVANATGTPSGGGGGGGGCIVLVSSSVTATQPTVTAGVTTVNGVTLTVAGGAAGAAGAGGGVAGNVGSAGTMILLAA